MEKVFTEIFNTEDQNKITNWKNQPTIQDLKQDFQEAKTAHNVHVTNINTWLDNLNITGSAKPATQENRSSVAPKLIRKQAEWRYAALSEPFLSAPKLYRGIPQSFEDKEAAEQAATVLNHQFNHLIKKVAFIDEYIRTAVDEGTVIVRLGWDFEEEEIIKEVPEFEQIPVTDPQLQTDLIAQGLPLVDNIQVGTITKKEYKTIKNQPTVDICEYTDVVIDPTCKNDLEKANFIIYKFETSISELKKDGKKYTNLQHINVDSNSPLSKPDNYHKNESSFTFKDKPRKKLLAYEHWGFWDYDDDGIAKPFVATYIGETIIRMEKIPFPDQKLPFVVVPFMPVRKSIYGEPDGELLTDNQKIIGAVTRGMIDIMGRGATGQTGIRKGALDVINRRKYAKGEDYEFNMNMDAASSFFTNTFPPIPQSAQYLLDQQNIDAESLTGVKAFANAGMSAQSLGTTATGVRSVMDAASKRELGILRRLAVGLQEIGRKIMSMNMEFLSEEEVIRVTNEDFITIRRDNIQGNYDVDLEISTAEADNQKAEELSFMLQTMGNNMDPALSRMLLADIAKLRKMPTLAKRIEAYQPPPPDPLAQRKAELEIGLLEATMENERAKALENATDVDYKRAKTATEEAKTRKLHSESDKDDLDFLRDDSGIKHQEQLEMKEQDRLTQLDLKAAEKLLSPDKSKQME